MFLGNYNRILRHSHFYLGLFTISLFTLLSTEALGQDHVIESTNVEYLQERAIEMEEEFNERKEEALRQAIIQGWPIRFEADDGAVYELMKIDEFGAPVYYTTNNEDAATASGTNELHSGGSLNLALDGNNMKIGEWDAGAVLQSHQEFSGRVNQVDNPSSTSNHATHVGGTMIAAGVVNSAQGMSYQADLEAHDWNNDNSEMATAAASGLLISNHSYGTLTGWQDGNWSGTSGWHWFGYYNHTEDYKFGWYNSKAETWDEIAYNAPYYLIVKSAGNNRSNNGPSSGSYQTRDQSWNWTSSSSFREPNDSFNTIPTYGNAKNILTVGAVGNIPGGYSNSQDVQMTSFSSWGPTDDGRIKPDLVANGTSIYSTSSSGNSDYTSLNGTSMAAPVVSGSLLLLQEHHFNLHNEYLRSSTLKGLAIHTAHEAGYGPGPDYVHGWGFLNTEGAANVISNEQGNHLLQEETLADQDTFTTDINVNGSEPLTVTICWTDPEASSTGGTFNNVLNNNTSKLINDLDLRVKKNTQEWEPYTLDPSNPSAPATTGDNDLDNTEKIYIENPASGNYTVQITHKGNLASAQDFSIIISGISQNLTAEIPNKNDLFCPGDSLDIDYTTFETLDTSNQFIAELSGPGGSFQSSQQIGVKVDSTSGNISAALPDSNTYSNNYLIRVLSTNPADTFVIDNQLITILGNSPSPFTENFDDSIFPPHNWRVVNPDEGITWQRDTSASGFGQSTASVSINNYSYNNPGELDYLHTPLIDFTGNPDATLEFDVAYAPYNATYSDTLEVVYSTDCGDTYTQKFRKGGSELATAPDETSYFVPDLTEWRTESIPLHSLNGYENVEIAFINQNGYGNAMYIDNIKIIKSDIQTGPVSKDTLCNEDFLSIPFDISGTFDSSNTFVAELSDSAGSFSDPMLLDSIQTNSPDTIIAQIPANLNAGDGYRVRVTSTQPNITGEKNSEDITIINQPDAYVANNDTTICAGEEVTFTANSGNQLSYQWFHNDDTLAGAESQSYKASQTGYFSVEVTQSGQCSKVSDSVHLSVQDKPDNEITTTGNTEFCEGDSVIFHANDTSGYNWQWFKNNDSIAGETGNAFSADTTGSYFLAIEDSYNCQNISDTFNVTMHSLPDIQINKPESQDTTVCPDQEVNLEAMPDTNYNYQWFFNGDSLDNATNHSLNANNEGAYHVEVLDQNSCLNSSGTKNVYYHSQPQTNVSINGNTEFCEGDSVIFHANDISGYNWQWFKDNDSIAGETENAFSADTTGSYFLAIEDSNNCQNTSDTFNVTLHSLPDIQINKPESQDTTVCPDQEVNLEAMQDANYNYQWFFNGDSLDNATNHSLNANNEGAYQIKILDQNSCLNSSGTKNVYYHSQPQTNVSINGDSEFCEGDSVSLSADKNKQYQWQWFKNNDSIESESGYEYYANQGGSYHLSYTDSNNCRNYSDTFDITVHTPPVVTIDNVEDTLICPYEETKLSASQISNVDYQWKQNGDTIVGATSHTFNAFSEGTYAVEITDQKNCKNTSQEVTISHHPLPQSNVYVHGNTEICEGDTVFFDADDQSSYQWQWFKSGDSLNTEFKATESGSYFAAYSDSNNYCINYSDTFDVQVNPLPVAEITNKVNKQTLCPFDELILHANEETSLEYQWILNGDSIEGATHPDYKISEEGNYKLKVQNQNNCTDVSDLFEIDYHDLPQANVIVDTDTEICNDDSVKISVEHPANYNWQWIRNGDSLKNQNTPEIIVNNTGNYHLTYSDSNNCINYSDTFEVVVNELPGANIINSDTTVCPGESITLLTQKGTNLKYQWKLNEDSIDGADQNTFETDIAGEYSLSITNDKNCRNTSDIVVLDHYPEPAKPEISDSGNVLISEFEKGNQWYDHEGPIDGADSQVFKPDVNGSYFVEVTNANGCAKKSDTTDFIISQLKSVEQQISANIFPNPSSQIFHIEIEQAIAGEKYSIEVFNAAGKKVYENVTKANAQNKLKYQLDFDEQEAGIYILMLTSNQISEQFRLILAD